MVASLDLWMDGDWGDESCAWSAKEVPFDFDRFQSDDNYAHLVSTHIQNAIDYLAKELTEIAVVTPVVKEDWRSCE